VCGAGEGVQRESGARRGLQKGVLQRWEAADSVP